MAIQYNYLDNNLVNHGGRKELLHRLGVALPEMG